MNLLPAKTQGKLDEKQRKALVTLLADDDLAVYQTVRRQILSHGAATTEWLREHTLSSDPVLRRRAREIINHFIQQHADTQFLAFCLNQGEDFDIEQGALLLARTQYPEINIEAYTALLDSFSGELRERLDLNGEPEQILATINDYLFDDLKFSGNEKNYYQPENSYLNCVLDRRTGNPLSLCLIYLSLARRLKLPMTGIGLPTHFLCRYQNSRAEHYVDVFNRGKLLTKTDCIKYLMRINRRLEEGHLAPVSSRRTLQRVCANLLQIYTQLKAKPEIERFQRYLVTLAK